MFAALTTFALTIAAACGGTVASTEVDAGGTPSNPDGGGSVGESAAPSAGRCIPPSAAPACCMTYGGWSESGQDTTTVCDNIPEPGTPGWTLASDAHGCAYWSAPPNAPIGCNGKPPPPEPDAGPKCCPIDDHPSCCMQYGGSASHGFCGTVCDGMPGPGYPGWEKRIDADGCPFWYTPPDAPHQCGAVADAGQSATESGTTTTGDAEAP
jgi:hypothetical protein